MTQTNPIPTYNDKIVAQGLARLTSAFITKPKIRAMLAVYLQPFQDIEDAIWQVLGGRFLATATVYAMPETNIVFDIIGALVGQARGLMDDSDYKAMIYLRIAVNRATGRVTDWSRFAQILLPYVDNVPIYYDDQAGIYFGLWNLKLSPNIVIASLVRAAPNGVGALIHYTTWPDGSDFEWSSRYDSSAGQLGWGSRYDASVGGLFCAAGGSS